MVTSDSVATGSSTVTVAERSLNRQVVLDEDEYTAALSQIIARDFFPSLAHLDATNDYLDALHSRDPHLIDATGRRLLDISGTPNSSTERPAPYQTPSQTPYAQAASDTPRGEALPKRARYDASLSLDEFQARYTSEDNSSFTHILNAENRKRKEQWSWAWDAQKRVEDQRERIVERREKMLLEAPSVPGVRLKFTIEHPVPKGLITAAKEEGAVEASEPGAEDGQKDKGKEVTLTVAEAEAIEASVMAPQKDNRSAGVDGWRFSTRNSLMFAPDADVSPYDSQNHPTIAPSDAKVIKHSNTRLEETSSPSRDISVPASPTRSNIDAAITGKPYPRSPTGKHFSLVPNIPSPNAAELGPAAVRQLMTWGTLNATPRIISQTEKPSSLPPPSTPFHLPELSSREAISHRLSSKASKSLRDKASLMGLGSMGDTPGIKARPPAPRRGNMPPPSWTPRRSEAAGNLTPAGRRLLEMTMGGTAIRRAEGPLMNNGRGRERELGKVRWTPTPSALSRP